MIDVEQAVARLIAGGVVAIPTETVYGLAADGLSAQSVARVFVAKGRPADNPLILHVADLDAALPLWTLSRVHERRVRRLASLWPGPVTAVLPASARVPAVVTAGLPTVAVRVPSHPVAQRILAGVARPLAAPSANRSGRPSPTTAAHVLADLADVIDGVVEGGPCTVGVESTVVDLVADTVRVLRPGSVSQPTLEDCLGEVVAPYTADRLGGSPGLRHRHYRPDVSGVRVVDDAARAWESGDALLVFAQTAGSLVARHGHRPGLTEVLPDSPEAAMRSLYAALRRFDGEAALWVEMPPDGAEWEALRDRLSRVVSG